MFRLKNSLVIVLLFFMSFSTALCQTSLASDTIPFIINKQNTMYVKAVLNNIDTLLLNFDTGSSDLTLKNDVLKNKIKSAPKLYNSDQELKIGKHVFKTKVFDTKLSGHDTDGRFGWDLFKDRVVEINYDKNILVNHPSLPDEVRLSKKYATLKMHYIYNVFFVTSQIKQKQIVSIDTFLFDTGYQRTAMLSENLLKVKNIPIETMPIIKKVIMHGAQGNEVPVTTRTLTSLKLGKFNLKNAPVQVTVANKFLKDRDVHILGNEILKRFNTFLDFQNNLVYLIPNHLYKVGYIEKKSIKENI